MGDAEAEPSPTDLDCDSFAGGEPAEGVNGGADDAPESAGNPVEEAVG